MLSFLSNLMNKTNFFYLKKNRVKIPFSMYFSLLLMGKKCKINIYDLPDLQLILYVIKINSNVRGMRKNQFSL